ncbi:MAG: glycoside hydrolase family 127 protein [Candidatus Atribacteria bacterium]|nr:glycoside hydrolase family 127 protein [Candidatus Atribacteria bacterium]
MTNLTNLTPIALKSVNIEESFWSRYVELIRDTVIPYQWEVLNDRIPGVTPSHSIKNYRIASGLEQGEFQGMVFQDTDVAKWIEAVAYSIETKPDLELEKTVDGVIDIIEKVQQPDGYLNTYYTLKEPGKRWTNFRECHELYCAGHMIEAAVAYYEATGKRKLLDIMCRFTDYIDSVIGPEPGKIKAYPGHQEIELALVKLYKVTRNEKYLKLSKYFIDERGKEPYYFDIEAKKRGNVLHYPEFAKFDRKYAQTHLPVRQQTTAEGHAVRAVYMYSAMADIAAETGDTELLEACRRIWDNIVTKRMYITGSIGSTEFGESFTCDYDLPNDTNYSETCASIGLMLFAYRMLQIEAKSCYADIMEKALYNTVLDGISLDGNSFFYVNPLEVWPEASEKSKIKGHVKVTRQSWFGCACCPPNIARLLASIGQYIYSMHKDEIYAHLYISSETEINVSKSKVKIKQETRYPWDEKVMISVSLDEEKEFSLLLRIPGWCDNAKICINREEINVCNTKVNGYAKLKRIWKNGDVVELVLPMMIQRIKAHPNVRTNIGKVALQRGPVVYCLEEIDNGSSLHEIVLPHKSELKSEFDDNLLGGITVITAEAQRYNSPWEDELYKANVESQYRPVTVKFIPYYAWANRTSGEMMVWITER